MQCACPMCGILMSHRIHGLESECCCPECGFICKACLGTNSIISKEMIREMAQEAGQEEIEQIYQENIDDEPC